MSTENVKAFFKRLEEDEAFRTEFLKIEKDGADAVIRAASDAGIPFTKEELEQAKTEPLSDELLDNVAGGLWPEKCWGYWV